MASEDQAAAAVANMNVNDSADAGKPAPPSSAGSADPQSLPAFVQHRLDLFDQAKKRYEDRLASIPRREIKVTLPDGNVKTATAGEDTPFTVASTISKSFAEKFIVAKVNGELRDMHRPLEEDCNLELCDFNSQDGKHVFWHSSAHVLGEALELIFDAKLCVGPPIEEGFYYDVAMDGAVSEGDVQKVEQMVKDIVKERQRFERVELTKEEALEMFKYNKYKVEIIGKKVPDGATCTAYRCGPLIDLCRGPHVPSTGKIKSYMVTKASSAYWLGDAKNDSLQRVYGVAFPDNKMLKEYKHRIEEAAKRDHRKIGLEQELFFFDPISPGSAFFLPHGTRIYNKLVEFIRKCYWKRGFEEVISPNVFNMQLYETSGHAQNYLENMFVFDVEEQKFAMKPMNCPGHCVMFRHRARSWRDLPLRFADFGVLHRNEYSGALHGLTRVRRFQQDDAHIFCMTSQVKDEIRGAIDFLHEVYGVFGFEYELYLSTRPEKYIGEVAVWDKAEQDLSSALDETGLKWQLNPGDGAFYGPKIDIIVFDALKRRHQCATIQLDFQLPERFGLEYAASDEDKRDRPVIIHRAILGSVERMFAILIEHTAGKWPFWISPRQIMIVPVAHSDELFQFASSVHERLKKEQFYCDVDLSDKSFKYKIRAAQLAQYNFILVVGEKEMNEGKVNVRTRDNKVHGLRSVDELVVEFNEMRDKFQ